MQDRKYHQGYFDCVAETLKFLIGADGSMVDEKLRTKMLQHLTEYYSETMTTAEKAKMTDDVSNIDRKCLVNNLPRIIQEHGCGHVPDNYTYITNNSTNNNNVINDYANQVYKKRRFSSGKSATFTSRQNKQESLLLNIFDNNTHHGAEQRFNLHQHQQQQPLDLTLTKNKSKATNSNNRKVVENLNETDEKMSTCAENCTKCLREIQQNSTVHKTVEYTEISSSAADGTRLRKLLESKTNQRRNTIKVEQMEHLANNTSENSINAAEFFDVARRLKFEFDKNREKFRNIVEGHLISGSALVNNEAACGLLYLPVTVNR